MKKEEKDKLENDKASPKKKKWWIIISIAVVSIIGIVFLIIAVFPFSRETNDIVIRI